MPGFGGLDRPPPVLPEMENSGGAGQRRVRRDRRRSLRPVRRAAVPEGSRSPSGEGSDSRRSGGRRLPEGPGDAAGAVRPSRCRRAAGRASLGPFEIVSGRWTKNMTGAARPAEIRSGRRGRSHPTTGERRGDPNPLRDTPPVTPRRAAVRAAIRFPPVRWSLRPDARGRGRAPATPPPPPPRPLEHPTAATTAVSTARRDAEPRFGRRAGGAGIERRRPWRESDTAPGGADPRGSGGSNFPGIRKTSARRRSRPLPLRHRGRPRRSRPPGRSQGRSPLSHFASVRARIRLSGRGSPGSAGAAPGTRRRRRSCPTLGPSPDRQSELAPALPRRAAARQPDGGHRDRAEPPSSRRPTALRPAASVPGGAAPKGPAPAGPRRSSFGFGGGSGRRPDRRGIERLRPARESDGASGCR